VLIDPMNLNSLSKMERKQELSKTSGFRKKLIITVSEEKRTAFIV
jgi:hypothetical protein